MRDARTQTTYNLGLGLNPPHTAPYSFLFILIPLYLLTYLLFGFVPQFLNSLIPFNLTY